MDHKTVLEKVARKMAELGYERHWVQCRQKIKNMKTDQQTNRKGKERVKAL